MRNKQPAPTPESLIKALDYRTQEQLHTLRESIASHSQAINNLSGWLAELQDRINTLKAQMEKKA